MHSKHRVAYWRTLGFPNCKLATAARMRKRAERKALAELQAQGLQPPVTETKPPPTPKRERDRL
jgi:hypothetical protein